MMDKRTDESTYDCPDCSESGLSLVNLDVHLRTVHLRLFPFECDQCQLVRLPTSDLLTAHLRSVHADTTNFKIIWHYDTQLEDVLKAKKAAAIQRNSNDETEKDTTSVVGQREVKMEQDSEDFRPMLSTERRFSNSPSVTVTARETRPLSTTLDGYFMRDGAYGNLPMPIVDDAKPNAILDSDERVVNSDFPFTSADRSETSSSALFCAVCNDATPINDPLAHICQAHLDPPPSSTDQVEENVDPMHAEVRSEMSVDQQMSSMTPEEQQRMIKKCFPKLIGTAKSPPWERHTCMLCNSQMARHHLRRHVFIHMELKPFACPKCPRTSERKERITSHIKTVHRDNQSVALEIGINPEAYQKMYSECFPHSLRITAKTSVL